MELFDYIEVLYNYLGQISPMEFERRAIEEGMDPMENRPERGLSGSTPIIFLTERTKNNKRRPTERHRLLNATERAQAQRRVLARYVSLFFMRGATDS